MLAKQIHKIKSSLDFSNRIVQDVSGTMTTMMAIMGDRLNLFKELTKTGPITARAFAKRMDLSERYIREWLRGMYSAEYLVYDPNAQTYHLPSNYQPALSEEEGPMFLGGLIQQISSLVKVLEPVMNSFKYGSGVSQEEYDPIFWSSIERESIVGFKHSLIPEWLEKMPDIREKMQYGIRVADIGCGNGRALTILAKAFPNSTFIGYDILEQSVKQARLNAEEEGITENLSFELLDITMGLPYKFDVITAFDVIHDMVNPQKALMKIGESMEVDGSLIILDFNTSDNLEENQGPESTILYGFSLMYCMTSSLAANGTALGTAGLSFTKLRELCYNADMYNIEKIEIENNFNRLYRIEF